MRFPWLFLCIVVCSVHVTFTKTLFADRHTPYFSDSKVFLYLSKDNPSIITPLAPGGGGDRSLFHLEAYSTLKFALNIKAQKELWDCRKDQCSERLLYPLGSLLTSSTVALNITSKDNSEVISFAFSATKASHYFGSTNITAIVSALTENIWSFVARSSVLIDPVAEAAFWVPKSHQKTLFGTNHLHNPKNLAFYRYQPKHSSFHCVFLGLEFGPNLKTTAPASPFAVFHCLPPPLTLTLESSLLPSHHAQKLRSRATAVDSSMDDHGCTIDQAYSDSAKACEGSVTRCAALYLGAKTFYNSSSGYCEETADCGEDEMLSLTTNTCEDITATVPESEFVSSSSSSDSSNTGSGYIFSTPAKNCIYGTLSDGVCECEDGFMTDYTQKCSVLSTDFLHCSVANFSQFSPNSTVSTRQNTLTTFKVLFQQYPILFLLVIFLFFLVFSRCILPLCLGRRGKKKEKQLQKQRKSERELTKAELLRLQKEFEARQQAMEKKLAMKAKEGGKNRNLTRTENEKTRAHEKEEKAKDRAHDRKERALDRSHSSREKQRNRQHESRERALDRSHSGRENRHKRVHESREKALDRRHSSRENSRNRQHQSSQQSNEHKHKEKMLHTQLTYEKSEKAQDRELEYSRLHSTKQLGDKTLTLKEKRIDKEYALELKRLKLSEQSNKEGYRFDREKYMRRIQMLEKAHALKEDELKIKERAMTSSTHIKVLEIENERLKIDLEKEAKDIEVMKLIAQQISDPAVSPEVRATYLAQLQLFLTPRKPTGQCDTATPRTPFPASPASSSPGACSTPPTAGRSSHRHKRPVAHHYSGHPESPYRNLALYENPLPTKSPARKLCFSEEGVVEQVFSPLDQPTEHVPQTPRANITPQRQLFPDMMAKAKEHSRISSSELLDSRTLSAPLSDEDPSSDGESEKEDDIAGLEEELGMVLDVIGDPDIPEEISEERARAFDRMALGPLGLNQFGAVKATSTGPTTLSSGFLGGDPTISAVSSIAEEYFPSLSLPKDPNETAEVGDVVVTVPHVHSSQPSTMHYGYDSDDDAVFPSKQGQMGRAGEEDGRPHTPTLSSSATPVGPLGPGAMGLGGSSSDDYDY
eukprot:GCRY01004079.1.p1 GENE.GCRY01004079.1~~GCRY01004079.1.p1  ORF type:complete len:1098 (+),score=269.27 GCRY01004079.1:220-3513(+)